MWHSPTKFKSLPTLILCAGIVLVKRDEEKLFPGAEKRDRSRAEKDFGLKRDGSGKSV